MKHDFYIDNLIKDPNLISVYQAQLFSFLTLAFHFDLLIILKILSSIHLLFYHNRLLIVDFKFSFI